MFVSLSIVCAWNTTSQLEGHSETTMLKESEDGSTHKQHPWLAWLPPCTDADGYHVCRAIQPRQRNQQREPLCDTSGALLVFVIVVVMMLLVVLLVVLVVVVSCSGDFRLAATAPFFFFFNVPGVTNALQQMRDAGSEACTAGLQKLVSLAGQPSRPFEAAGEAAEGRQCWAIGSGQARQQSRNEWRRVWLWEQNLDNLNSIRM